VICLNICISIGHTKALLKSSTKACNLRRGVVFPPRGLICSRRRRPFVQLAFQIVIAQLLVTNLALVFAYNRFSSRLVRLIFFCKEGFSHECVSSISLISLPHFVLSQISKSPPAVPGSWPCVCHCVCGGGEPLGRFYRSSSVALQLFALSPFLRIIFRG
jgi:hypothetical protein